MGRIAAALRRALRKGDMILLMLCLLTSGFGCLVISSVMATSGAMRYLVIQLVAIGLGVMLYVLVSAVDAEFLSEHRGALVAFNTFLLLLLIPIGTDNGTGNKSWLDIPFLPINIQPAEICKIAYILIMASVMNAHQNRINSIRSIMHMAFHGAFLVLLNIAVSHDAGVSLIFVFIFVGMAFAGGVSMGWFGLGVGALVAVAPILWSRMGDYQRNRILILFDPTIDPQGLAERWHTNQSLLSLTGGGFDGQGLYQGHRTQTDALFAKHTDYIFSSIGEELGFLGCMAVLLLEFAIIARCIYVGMKSPDYMRRLICAGAASALIFQVGINVGMCIGVAPVIGLTLPFISYGGSSTLSLYAMLGLVSGVHARPEADSHQLYVSPYRG